jgi:hypothetical protein
VLEGGDGVLKRVLGGAGESYLGLFFSNLFVTSIAAGMTFRMSKVLRITWLYVALHLKVVCNISKVGQNH